jgi:hypothetical protein
LLLILQDDEKVLPASFSRRLEAQRTTPQVYASPLRSLRPRWTVFLTILQVLKIDMMWWVTFLDMAALVNQHLLIGG